MTEDSKEEMPSQNAATIELTFILCNMNGTRFMCGNVLNFKF